MSWKSGLSRLLGQDIGAALGEYVPPKTPLAEQPVPGTRAAPSVLAAARETLEEGRAFAPHCDARILHQPGECWSCDLYPDWQALRKLWGIAFTGRQPAGDQLPCPADHSRPPGSPSDHRRWGPNTAQGDLT